ncbi:glycosyltransferase [Phycicoccus sp. CSK15P-2]|uniref:glycosyltransferase family 4 protein n=1 Tax=Phycicoccus sp. CSK15P-2 TaxID=2807627 RepID=UPI001950DE74|nr:glycosyltransferase family 4 protein [Phycicoccus sp. CSK15P-2]MBM6403508.1 glycosyltransferase [Phycicoccus sp. CSK15P-2]
MTSVQRTVLVVAGVVLMLGVVASVVLLLVVGWTDGGLLAMLGAIGLLASVSTATIVVVGAQAYRRRANIQATRIANLEKRLAAAVSPESLALLGSRLDEVEKRRTEDPRVALLDSRLAETDARVVELEQRPVADPRVDSLGARLDEQERAARDPHPGLAEDMYETVQSLTTLAHSRGVPLEEVLSLRQATNQVRAAVARDRPLDSIRLLEARPDIVESLGLTETRRLMRRLRQLGFLGNAAHLMGSIATRFGKPEDMRAAALLASELDLYEGRVTGDVPLPPLEGPPNADTVVHVVGSALPERQSGYTLRTQYTVEAQARAGITPVVVTQSGATARAHELTETYVHGGVRYFLLGGPQRGAVPWDEWVEANVRALAETVSMVRPAALHVHSDFINAVIAHPVATQYGIPVVNETRGFWEESWLSRTANAEGWQDLAELEARVGLPEVYRLRVEREAQMRSSASAVVTLARVMQSHIGEVATSLDLPAPPVSIAPNAVAVEDFPVVGRSHALREQLGFSPDTMVVGYISSIVEYEGIDTLVRAMSDVEVALDTLRSQDVPVEDSPTRTEVLSERLRPRHPSLDPESLDAYSCELALQVGRISGGPVQLLVVGDGAELETLRLLAESLGMRGAVFTGRVPHDSVLEYYGAIDLFVVPRKRAAVTELVTPLKPYEAMSTGRPCVFSDVGALAEIAEDSGAATLFRAGDVLDLATTVAALLADPDRMATMASTGASWTRSERTWDLNARVYLDVYRSLGMDVGDMADVPTTRPSGA